MSGRELDPDGTDSYHPEHPWEQVGHSLYVPAEYRTKANWPPLPAKAAGPYEAELWSRLPGDSRVRAVSTGQPPVLLLACTLCGVILWDIDAHYAHTHASHSNGDEL